METAIPQTAAERVAAMKARRQAEGLAKVADWIPDTPEARAKLKAYCERLRKADKRT